MFTFVPKAFSSHSLKDDEDDQWDLFEINSSAQACDGSGNRITLSARSAMANPGNWQSMVTEHAKKMIEFLESVVIQQQTL